MRTGEVFYVSWKVVDGLSRDIRAGTKVGRYIWKSADLASGF
jgi:hypothetical protein